MGLKQTTPGGGASRKAGSAAAAAPKVSNAAKFAPEDAEAVNAADTAMRAAEVGLYNSNSSSAMY
jgi:hypothetical protein